MLEVSSPRPRCEGFGTQDLYQQQILPSGSAHKYLLSDEFVHPFVHSVVVFRHLAQVPSLSQAPGFNHEQDKAPSFLELTFPGWGWGRMWGGR